MAGVTQGRAARGGIVGINVTPMVDVVLVLLIIMMVSATYIVSQSLKVQLPKTASSDETVAKTYVVTVTKDGNYFYNDKAISREGRNQRREPGDHGGRGRASRQSGERD